MHGFAPAAYHVFLCKGTERYLHFDFNDIADVDTFPVRVDFKGDYYVLVDQKA